jgi:transposase
MKAREYVAAMAHKRAELIIQVQAGRMSASEAATRLGVSRKTYYKWEQRALEGILEGLQEGKAGRRAAPRDPEKEGLKRELEELRAKVGHQEQILKVRDMLKSEWASKPEATATEKKGKTGGNDPQGHR